MGMSMPFVSAAVITRAHAAPPCCSTAAAGRVMAPLQHSLQRQQKQFSLCLPSQHSQWQRQQQRLCRHPICMAAAVPLAVLAAASGSGGASAAAAVVVGWLVVAGSCFRSVPQILRILKFRSVEGLSLAAFVVESLACAITSAYHARHAFPLSTYGDSLICLAQNFVIIALIFFFNARAYSPAAKVATAGGLVAATAWLLGGGAGPGALRTLQGGVLALMVASRLPQIWINLRRGDSGELSMASMGLSAVGNAMRVFTTLALLGDPLVLAGAASQLCMNGVLLAQTVATARRRAAAAVAPAAG